MKLTNTKVKNLPLPIDKEQHLEWDSETRGFGIRISRSGSKSWIVQGRVYGKTRRVTLGPFELLSADEARKRAQAKLLEMYDGKDPQVEKKKLKAQGETLREVMEDYIQHKRTKNGALRPSSKDDIRRCVEGTFSDWADKPVATISRDACIKKFRELSKTAPIQTNQSFRNLRALLNWAREKNATADGTYPILPVNPVSQMFRKGGLVQWNPEKARASRIPKDRIGAVWAMLEDHSNPENHITTTCISADLIAFMLLTGCRVSEACKLTWKHVKLDDKVPTFHLEITKNHNPITLPISSALHEVLSRRYEERVKGNNYVFPAMRGKKGYLSDPRALFKKVSEVAGVHLHPHALRRSYDDAAQFVGIDSDQRRQLLNHLATDVHGQNYSNNPDPAALLPAAQKIGEWIIKQGDMARAVEKGDNVVPLSA